MGDPLTSRGETLPGESDCACVCLCLCAIFARSTCCARAQVGRVLVFGTIESITPDESFTSVSVVERGGRSIILCYGFSGPGLRVCDARIRAESFDCSYGD